MKRSKRVWAALTAVAVGAVLPTFVSTEIASAGTGVLSGAATLHTPNGAAVIPPGTGGTSATGFTLRLPAAAACAGDSAGGNYRVQGYLVPDGTDLTSLQFTGAGPNGAGQYALFDTNGDPYTNQNTDLASTPGGPGQIINIPNFNLSAYGAGVVAPGIYNIGIACSNGPADADQMSRFWNAKMTIGAGTSFVAGATAAIPTLTAVTPGSGSLSATFTPGLSDPAATSYTATATSSVPGATTPVSASGSASPIVIPGLTPSAVYSVTLTATNAVGTSAASNSLTGTVLANGAVQNLAQSPAPTPGGTTVSLDWDAPTGPTPTGYDVTINSTFGAVNVAGTSATITTVPVGVHSCTVTPTYPAPQVGTPASVACSIVPNTLIIQEITVTRPVGALVITQKCGATGTAPLTGPGGTGIADPRFVDYPYPVDANGVANATYPTYCGVSLGTAKLITSGTGAGQFFRATGELAEVTVVDTRDSDLGWTVNGTMANFLAGAGDSFSGSQLGWTPAAPVTTPAYTDSLGNTYTQLVNAGAAVAPNTAAASGLSSGRPLATAPTGTASGGGLGIAVLEAGLELLIPVTANNGNYTGVLTLTVA